MANVGRFISMLEIGVLGGVVMAFIDFPVSTYPHSTWLTAVYGMYLIFLAAVIGNFILEDGMSVWTYMLYAFGAAVGIGVGLSAVFMLACRTPTFFATTMECTLPGWTCQIVIAQMLVYVIVSWAVYAWSK